MIAGVVAGGRPYSASAGPAIPTAGLIAWYKMDSIAGGVLSDETALHSGTISNATGVSGKIGSAIQFNGSNTLGSIPDNADLNQSALTVSLWINFTSAANLVIAEKGGNNGWSLQIIDEAVAAIHGGNAGGIAMVSGGTKSILRTSAAVNNGAWRHIAATINYAAGISKLYVDGALSSPAIGSGSSVSGVPTYISGPLSIGQRPTNIGPFVGSIDNIRYYNRVLSAAEVLQLFNE